MEVDGNGGNLANHAHLLRGRCKGGPGAFSENGSGRRQVGTLRDLAGACDGTGL